MKTATFAVLLEKFFTGFPAGSGRQGALFFAGVADQRDGGAVASLQ